jgi:two-component system, OmpR family, sensor histidine kinase MprB
VTLAAGGAVLLAVVAVSIAVYVVVRTILLKQIDQSLSQREHLGQQAVPHDLSTVLRHVPLAHETFFQVVNRDGGIVASFDDRPLPVTTDVLAIARGERGATFFDATIEDSRVRVYAAPAGEGTALVVGRSLTEVEQALRQLVWTLAGISLAAAGLAAVGGRLVAAAAITPVRRVAEAADAVARTGELSHHIAVSSGDDLGRLAASFNTMLDALSASLARQRQLVADAMAPKKNSSRVR